MDINIDSSKAMLLGALPADGQDNNKGLIIAHTNTLGLFLRTFARIVFFIIKGLSCRQNYFLVKFAQLLHREG